MIELFNRSAAQYVYVSSSKIHGSRSASQMGCEYGGRLTLVDDAMFVRFREIHLGVGRYSLEGRWPATHLLLHEVSAVRKALMAQTCP